MDKEQLKAEIRRLCDEKKAVVMAHYYTVGEVQEVADFVGDSLALARKAAETDARIIVMCGVHFMAETCKLLSPDKLVLECDPEAGCSLADSCSADDLRKWKQDNPGYMVVQYVNTTAATKALTDVVVTSGNARKVIDQLPKDAKILFGPDYNLGNYINSVTGREMVLWNGGCHVHERFSIEAIAALKQANPDAIVMAHLECKAPVLALADVKGSTADMLKYAQANPSCKYIVATESGILHELQRTCPETEFIPVPPATPLADDVIYPASRNQEESADDSVMCSAFRNQEESADDSVMCSASRKQNKAATPQTCHCNECEFMKLNSLEKLYNALKNETPSVEIPSDIANDAVKPITRMLELS